MQIPLRKSFSNRPRVVKLGAIMGNVAIVPHAELFEREWQGLWER